MNEQEAKEKIKKYPRQYSTKDLERQTDEYANQSVGSKDPDILIQHFAKAGLGIAELQRRIAKKTLLISISALLLGMIGVVISIISLAISFCKK